MASPVPSTPPGSAGSPAIPRGRVRATLVAIAAVSLLLNLWGNDWGAPAFWHGDEVVERVMIMVNDRDPSPHFFAYGSLPYHVTAAGAAAAVKTYEAVADQAPPASDSLARGRWSIRHEVRIFQASRAIAALQSTAIVVITFLIANWLFGAGAALLAALLLAVSRTFVVVGHFATVDSAVNLWYWLACLFGVLIWMRGDRKWYVLAAVAAGIAIGIKVDRLVVLLPLLIAHLLNKQRPRPLAIAAMLPLFAAGFLIANLTLLFAPFEFLDGFTRELAFNMLRPLTLENGFAQIPHYIVNGLGVPLAVLIAASLGYALLSLRKPETRLPVLWILSAIVPYYVLMSRNAALWTYILLPLPGLIMLAGYTGVDVLEKVGGLARSAVTAALAGVAAYSLMYTVAQLAQFGGGTREQAGEWLERNAPPGATVATSWRGPILSREKDYEVVVYPPDRGRSSYMEGQGAEILAHHPVYSRIRAAILAAERWAGRTFGLAVRPEPYQAWFDQAAHEVDERQALAAEEADTLRGNPDYIVLLDDFHPTLLRVLATPGSGYELVERYRDSDPLGVMHEEFRFINPSMSLFRRATSSMSAWSRGAVGLDESAWRSAR